MCIKQFDINIKEYRSFFIFQIVLYLFVYIIAALLARKFRRYLMKSVPVKDIMVELEDYATVSEEATLYEAVKATVL
jgi:hypothetical protein